MRNKQFQYWFTSDEHYFHKNIIKYCNRPFKNVEDMNECLINNFNSVVGNGDVTIHGGDFSLGNERETYSLISKLNGTHIFLKGSHDRWSKRRKDNQIWEKTINGKKIVVCHYAMRVWAASHYNSYHLFGHSHGTLDSVGKSMDIGVDTNNYYPYSFDDICKIMETKPDNFNLLGKLKK